MFYQNNRYNEDSYLCEADVGWKALLVVGGDLNPWNAQHQSLRVLLILPLLPPATNKLIPTVSRLLRTRPRHSPRQRLEPGTLGVPGVQHGGGQAGAEIGHQSHADRHRARVILLQGVRSCPDGGCLVVLQKGPSEGS